MISTGAALGAVTGLALGPWLAGLVHTAPESGPWWAPWRSTGRRFHDVSWRLRVVVGALAVAWCALAGAAAGWGPAWAAFAFVGLAGAPLAVIDVRVHRLPDRIVFPTAAGTVLLLALGWALRDGPLLRALVCGLAEFALLLVIALAAPRSFGLGDAKLGGVLGLLLGWISVDAVVLGLFAGYAVGAIASLALIATGRAGLKTPVAFGPALLLGALGTAAVLAPTGL